MLFAFSAVVAMRAASRFPVVICPALKFEVTITPAAKDPAVIFSADIAANALLPN